MFGVRLLNLHLSFWGIFWLIQVEKRRLVVNVENHHNKLSWWAAGLAFCSTYRISHNIKILLTKKLLNSFQIISIFITPTSEKTKKSTLTKYWHYPKKYINSNLKAISILCLILIRIQLQITFIADICMKIMII